MTVPQNVKLARHPIDLDDDGHEFVELGVTTETDTTLRLAPDGAGGVEWGTGGSGVSYATPSIALGSSAAAGAASTVIRSDSTIAAFDATSPSTQAIGDSAVVGSAAFASRRDHKHAITNPLTTQDDLWVGGASGAPARLAKGSDGQVLTVDPSTHHLVWATPSGGFTDPMTTRGDMIIRNPSNVTARLGRGSTGQVLTSDGTDLSWQTPTTGGGGAGADAITGQIGGGGAIIPGLSGSPDIRVAGANDDEFDTTAAGVPTGWTGTANTPTTQNANTTWKSHYYVSTGAIGGDRFYGIFKAAPSIPYTVTVKVSDATIMLNYQGVGLAICDNSVLNGKAVNLCWQCIGTVGYSLTSWTTFVPGGGGNASGAAGIGSQPANAQAGAPAYLRAVVTAANNVAYYVSHNGMVFHAVTTGNAFLAAATYVAITIDPQNFITAAAIDWVRFT